MTDTTGSTSQPAVSESPGDDGHLRVGDQDREDAIERLVSAATDGRLTLDEYSERSERALVAVTRSDLSVLTHDLGPVVTARAYVVSSSEPTERVSAVFGSDVRRGRWAVSPRMEVRALFGECRVELQRASLHSRVTSIKAKATFGSVEIVVPEGVEVRMSGSALFGERRCDVEDAPAGSPVLEVVGRARFGSIVVRHPKRDEAPAIPR